MRISDWSSDVCSSDLDQLVRGAVADRALQRGGDQAHGDRIARLRGPGRLVVALEHPAFAIEHAAHQVQRSEEHTSELQSLMRISYAVFCLKKKNQKSSSTNRPDNYYEQHEILYSLRLIA